MNVCSVRFGLIVGLSLFYSTSQLSAEEKKTEKPEPAKAKYLLRYQFEEGDVLHWNVVHKATIKSTVQGTSQTAWTSSSSQKAWRIDKVSDDGEVTFTHLVERVQMANQISGRAKVEWDSSSKEKVPLGFQDAAKAVGVPLTEVRMTTQGKILQRLEKLNQPGANNDTPITILFPEEAIPVGHVWSEPHEVRLKLKAGGTKAVQTRRRFELLSVKHDVALISVNFQILSPLRDPALEAQLIQRLAKGELRFDINAGRLLSQQLDVDRRLHDFSGPGSLMHYLSRFTEELSDGNSDETTEEKKVATKPTGKTEKK